MWYQRILYFCLYKLQDILDIKILNLQYCLQRHDNPDFRVSHKSKCTSPLQTLSLFYSAFDRTENWSGS